MSIINDATTRLAGDSVNLPQSDTSGAAGAPAVGVKPEAGDAASEPRSGEPRQVAESIGGVEESCLSRSERARLRTRQRYVRRWQAQQWLWSRAKVRSGQAGRADADTDMASVRALAGRTAMCGQRIADPDLRRGDRTCVFHGVATCGSPWACPTCSSALRAGRADEVQQAAESQLKAGGSLLFLTLTVRHGHGMPLSFLLPVLLGAWVRFQQGRAWRSRAAEAGIFGQIKSVEITYSIGDSWHPHLHIILFSDKKLDEAAVAVLRKALTDPVKTPWQDRWGHWREGPDSHPWPEVVETTAGRLLDDARKLDGHVLRDAEGDPFMDHGLPVVADGRYRVNRVRKGDGWLVNVFDRLVNRVVWRATATRSTLESVGETAEQVAQAYSLAWNRREVKQWEGLTAGQVVPTGEIGVKLELVKDAAKVAAYVSKFQDVGHTWGIGAEMTRGDVKDAGRTAADGDVHVVPFELLDDDCVLPVDLSTRKALWSEYVDATRGRDCIIWSPGLKLRFHIDKVSDEDILEQATEHILAVWNVDPDSYSQIRRTDPARLAEAVSAMARGDYERLAALLPGHMRDGFDDDLSVVMNREPAYIVQTVDGAGTVTGSRVLTHSDVIHARTVDPETGELSLPSLPGNRIVMVGAGPAMNIETHRWVTTVLLGTPDTYVQLELDLGDPAGSSRGGNCAAAA